MLEVAETQFDVMNAEWQGIVNRTSLESPSLSTWEADMGRLSDEHDELMRNGRWVVGDDDVLSIIRRARYETYHSAMLAWLLNPLGKHGLGTTLLEALLRLCGVGVAPDLHWARPEVEVPRSDTRADIVVFAPGITLIIENKVDAGEQERQCDRLYTHFGTDPGARFVFLTPTGHAPRTATEPGREAWTILSYRMLATLLDEALGHPAANASASGRSTAQNYLVTLRKEFV